MIICVTCVLKIDVFSTTEVTSDPSRQINDEIESRCAIENHTP